MWTISCGGHEHTLFQFQGLIRCYQWNITLDSVILRHGIPENTFFSLTWLLVLFVEKSTFETHMGAAILCTSSQYRWRHKRPACVTKVPKYVMSLLLFSSPSPFFSFLCSSVVKTEHRPDITVMVDWGVKHQVTYLLAEPTWLRPEGVQIRSKKSTYADRSKTKRAADGNTYLHIFNDDDKACPLIKVPRRRWRLAFELGTKTKLKHLRIIICTFLTKIKSVIWLRYQDENEACPFDLGTKTKAKPAPWFWY